MGRPTLNNIKQVLRPTPRISLRSNNKYNNFLKVQTVLLNTNTHTTITFTPLPQPPRSSPPSPPPLLHNHPHHHHHHHHHHYDNHNLTTMLPMLLNSSISYLSTNHQKSTRNSYRMFSPVTGIIECKSSAFLSDQNEVLKTCLHKLPYICVPLEADCSGNWINWIRAGSVFKSRTSEVEAEPGCSNPSTSTARRADIPPG